MCGGVAPLEHRMSPNVRMCQPLILWPTKYFGKSCCTFSIETVNTELAGNPILWQLVPPPANAPRSKWHPLTMCPHKCHNSVQHEGRRCTQRKGCQSCGIFNVPKGCTGLFDRVWPLACTRDLLAAQQRLQYQMAFQGNSWWEESLLHSRMGKPALHRALLVFYLTFVNLGWFLRASANAFAPSSPTWLPHILVKRGEHEVSVVLPYWFLAMHSPCFSPLPSFLVSSQSFRLVRNLAGTLPSEASMFHCLLVAPVISADSPAPSGHSRETACCSRNALGITLLHTGKK